jgi:pilus assembly protein CpaB
MVLRLLLYGIMAFALAGFAAVAWLATRPPAAPPAQVAEAPPPPAPHPRIGILVAAHPLRAGALLGPDDMTGSQMEQPAPDIALDTPETRAAMLGGMVRHNLAADAPLHTDTVLRPKDRGFLAAVLEPGMRAVSVAVDPVSGAAGLIWPSDRVDVLLTQSVDVMPPARRISGEIMLTDVRVIAVDQQLMQGMVGAEGVDHTVRTVTLEVTPAQAERIAVGARLGRLSLILHASRADSPATAASRTPAVTWAGDVSAALPEPRASEPLRVYNGPGRTEEVHF